MKSGYIFSLVFLCFGIVFGVVVDVVLFPMLWQMLGFEYNNPGGLGWGAFFGFVGSISLILYLDSYWFECVPDFRIPYRKSKPKDPFWSQGNAYEKVEEIEVKDDYKSLDWLRHHYYELGKSLQDIADEQGVSMMTIRKWLDKHKTCPHCGSHFSDNLKFCGKCGEPLNN